MLPLVNRSGAVWARVPREPARASTTDRRSNTVMDWRPALDCREHPPAERACDPGTGTREWGPLDGLGSASKESTNGRAKLIWCSISGGLGGTGMRLTQGRGRGTTPPHDLWPPPVRRAGALQIRHQGIITSKRNNTIPSLRAPLTRSCGSYEDCSWQAAFQCHDDRRLGLLREPPSRRLREA